MPKNLPQLSLLDLNNIKIIYFWFMERFVLTVGIWAAQFFYLPTFIIFEKDSLKKKISVHIYQAHKKAPAT